MIMNRRGWAKAQALKLLSGTEPEARRILDVDGGDTLGCAIVEHNQESNLAK